MDSRTFFCFFVLIGFWPTVFGRAFATGCRLSVCLSVTFCTEAKRCILEQKFLLQRIGSRIHRIDFCHSYRPLLLFRGHFRSCRRYACVQIFPSTSETYLFTALPVLGLAASASQANHSRLACQDRQIDLATFGLKRLKLRPKKA